MIKIVVTTFSSDEEAQRLATEAVQSGLVACANIIPNVLSIYRWKGEICKESEKMVIFKTKSECYDNFIRFLSEKHPYEIPEILTLNPSDCSQPYLTWVESQCQNSAS